MLVLIDHFSTVAENLKSLLQTITQHFHDMSLTVLFMKSTHSDICSSGISVLPQIKVLYSQQLYMTYYCTVYDAKYVAKCIIFYKIIQGKGLIRKQTEWQSCHVKILTFFYLFSTLCQDSWCSVRMFIQCYGNLLVCFLHICHTN